MPETAKKGPWELLSESLGDYLVVTRHISEWLGSYGSTDEDPSFDELEKMIEERREITALLSETDISALPDEPAEDREKMSRTLVLDIADQIRDLEAENQSAMDSMSADLRAQLKKVRQARETLSTYGKQQAYGMQPDLVGTRFNEAN